MKHIKEIAMRVIPLLIVIAVTVVLSEVMYRDRMENAQDKSWASLEMATQDVAREIQIRFTDNLVMLDLAAEAIDLGAVEEEALLEHIAALCKSTIFQRIDVIYPNGKILLQTGDYATDEGRTSFGELAGQGAHLSTRITDPYTGREVFHYFTPMINNGQVEGILSGTVDCDSLGDLFTSGHYEGNGRVFLVDLRDGQFLVDRWHAQLGSIYTMPSLVPVPEYADRNFVSSIMAGEKGSLVFTSEISGRISYMHYLAVEGLPFGLSLVVPEEVVFTEVRELKRVLTIVGIVEVTLLAGYLIWFVVIMSHYTKNKEKVRLAQLEQEKSAAKSRFLSSVSHDIRTPLNGIIGMLDVIRLRGEVPEHLTRPLYQIDVSAKYLLSLANDVLDLNELEAGKLVMEREPVDLRELIGDLDIMMTPRAESKGLEYSSDCSSLTCPLVLGSGVHISKILMNLVGNAIKYNQENGRIWVTLWDEPGTDGGRNYCFAVRDTGIGMTEDFQKTMFQAFEQENTGARTERVGHGLGLSIVKQLVDLMGGTIVVESEKGLGSTFTVTLPLTVQTAGEKPEEAEPLEELTGTRILVAEDNELNMEIAKAILQETGAQVTAAFNGEMAVESFRDSPVYGFDLILMDVMMPVMDGREATQAIRGLDRPDAGTVPILAMTASAFSEDIRRSREAGMNDHLSKPLDMNALVTKVAKEIARYRAQQAK